MQKLTREKFLRDAMMSYVFSSTDNRDERMMMEEDLWKVKQR
jgi:hypothetical protein